MGQDSVLAAQFGGGDRCQHLALYPREGRTLHHDGAVEADAGAHRLGIQAHDMDDVPDPSGAFDRRIELAFEEPGGLVDWNLIYPGHEPDHTGISGSKKRRRGRRQAESKKELELGHSFT